MSQNCSIFINAYYPTTSPKEKLVLVGNHPNLGNWDPLNAFTLEKSSENLEWHFNEISFPLPQNIFIEFKLVVLRMEEKKLLEWEELPGNSNRLYCVPSTTNVVLELNKGDPNVYEKYLKIGKKVEISNEDLNDLNEYNEYNNTDEESDEELSILEENCIWRSQTIGNRVEEVKETRCCSENAINRSFKDFQSILNIKKFLQLSAF